MRYVKRSKLADAVLKPLEDMLAGVGHCGYVDTNCIIGEDGTPWPLELTMRFGWPTTNILQELHDGDFIEWLAHLSEGRDARNLRLNRIACGSVMAIPQYPYLTPVEKMIGVPIYNLNGRIMDRIHPACMMWGDAPQDVNGKTIRAPMHLSAGDYVLIASGSGKTVQQARAQSQRALKSLAMPSSPYWRPDIGQRLKKQIPELNRHGLAMGMTY